MVDPDRLIVAPTRAGPAFHEGLGIGPGPGTETVAATFLHPASGEVVDQVVVGDTLVDTAFGSSVAVSPDRRMAAVTWGLGTTVLDTRTREVVAEIVLPSEGELEIGPLPSTVVWCAAWTPDGATLLLGAESAVDVDVGQVTSADGYLAVVDTRTWEVGGRVDIGGAAQSIAVSPDDSLLAVASASAAEIVLVDAATLEVDRRIPLATDDRLFDLAFSRDGRLLAGGGELGLLHLFDTASWEPVREPAAVHEAAVLQVEWVAGGRTVATTDMDGAVAVYDAERGLVRGRSLRGSGEPKEGYAFLVPGPEDELVVLGGDRTGRRYPLEPAVWLDEACAIVGRDLTAAEWDRYLPGRERTPTCTDLP
jgi:hypothetical protein